jgi:hypothetical protein
MHARLRSKTLRFTCDKSLSTMVRFGRGANSQEELQRNKLPSFTKLVP